METPLPSDTQTHYKIFFISLCALALFVVAGYYFYTQERRASLETKRPAKIYVSSALHRSNPLSAVNSIQLAFEEAGNRAGGKDIELVIFDNSDEKGALLKDIEEQMATAAANDPDVIAYIGPHNTDVAKISMPILNRAGIAQIVFSGTASSLTRYGFVPGEPGILYPTGSRHFVRVCPRNDTQGATGAIWANKLGVKSVYIIDDGESYGKGIADAFAQRARQLNFKILGQIHLNKSATDFTQEIQVIQELNPDLVYFGGIGANGSTYLLSQMRALGMKTKFMGGNGIVEQSFIDKSGKALEEVYGTNIGAPAKELGTVAAQNYNDKYVAKYGVEPESYGIFGYEAAKVLIDAMNRAPSMNRADVMSTLLATKNFNGGALGDWSFDEYGDTTLSLISGYIIKDGKWQYVQQLHTP